MLLAGVVAVAFGFGLAELVAGALARTTTPFFAVGEAFIDIVPGWLKDLAVQWFGTADKAVLLAGMVAFFVVGSALVGWLTARSRGLGVAVAAAVIVLVALAVWSRPDTTAVDLLPAFVGGVATLFALDWLVRRATAPDPPSTAGGVRGTRRSFMTGAGALGVLAVASGGLGRALGSRRTGVEASRQDLSEQVDFPEPEVPAGTELGVAPDDPWRTPNRVFYRIDTALSVPLLAAADWRLRVHGMVEREVTLTYEDLLDLGLVDRWVTLTCVSNEVGGGLAGNALWTGVPVADVLALATPSPDADAIRSTSDDGWNAGTPLDVLTDGRDALFAIGMNGEPLPVEHGFPVRIVVPGLYGYVSATKWVVDVEVTRFDAFEAYWTTRGWSERGPIKVASRIDVPRLGTELEAGTIAVAGVAWAQHRGIGEVEVRVDEGDWRPARLAEVPSADTWRQWVYEWDATPGQHALEVRATTADGEVQTDERRPPAPDGATGWDRVVVEVNG